MLTNAYKALAKHWLSKYHKVFIQASGLAYEVYVEVSPLCSFFTTVCEIKVCLISVILCY